MNTVLTYVREELQQQSDRKVFESSQRFFKEAIKTYGVKVPVAQKIAKKYFKTISSLDKKEIWKLCKALWKSGYLEESMVACTWSYGLRKQYEPEDFAIFEDWIQHDVNNWASCDTLCNHTVGTFIDMYPAFVNNLRLFAKSNNRWMKRAAAVSLIIPAKEGKFLKDIFDVADLLLEDSDDLIQKGYGWMLKAASQSHEKAVFDYVIKHKKKMPRTALRYAIEKMPKEMKAVAMAKD